MKEKFKKVKDKQTFFKLISEKTGVMPQNISSNWFGRGFIVVPKNWILWTDDFLDRYLELEKEKAIDDKNRLIKYFGK